MRPTHEGKLKYLMVEHSCKIMRKKQGAYLRSVVNFKLWCGQLCKPVTHMPVHCVGSPWVVVVAQEVEGLEVLLGDGTETSLACEFIAAMFGQPLAKFLDVALVSRHDSAHCRNSQLVLQQV